MRKLPLRIGPSYHLNKINIADDTRRIVCSMDFDDIDLARRIVRRENGWWRTLFGSGRDARQKEHDQWVAQRNFYRGGVR